MNSGRWVSYIYRYREGRRCENAGFIKVQRTGCEDRAKARIQIGIKLYKNKICRCITYLIYRGKTINYLTDICIQPKERDTIVKRVELPWDNPLGDGRHIKEYCGIVFVCDDGEILASSWGDYEFSVDDIWQEVSAEKNIEEEKKQEETKNEEENTEEIGQDVAVTQEECISKNEEMDPCEYMLSTYPKLPVFVDSQIIECVKIVPHDIGMLPMANWKLGVNSFLSHGYYHYRYIMMGRVHFDSQEIYVIGVPGVFTNKEKYLANMFGFNVFIPAKNTDILTGNFGYWISEIVRE
ncbi:MAG: hypothetical protein E7259_07845 [Lachnospiraceae bacterium]|nr:hypothetical protein [Lachnospiraceae bacterium]